MVKQFFCKMETNIYKSVNMLTKQHNGVKLIYQSWQNLKRKKNNTSSRDINKQM